MTEDIDKSQAMSPFANLLWRLFFM